ncbi:3-oxoacyl-ACP reductase [Rickettsiales bacterium]|nr:3-oxoacyl-ACP reductase [Rickettsiales bacterium]
MARLAIITGGTRGIGASISKMLRDSGYIVAANYAHNDAAAKEFTKETGIKTFKWDVASLESCEEGVAKVIKNLKQTPDILVNNAGIIRDGMLHKMSLDNWSDVIQTNLSSCFNMSHCVINHMRENNFGRIVNISSINALAGQVGQTNYSAAKAGMLGFTKALARENARKNITVNAVAPGYIHTDMTDNVSESVMSTIVSQIPVGRLGKPEEVARAVAFLVDDNAGFITGETISVNGGHHMA